MARDPYQVLQLRPGASLAEVKRAYRRLAKINHPDSAGESALPRFLELQHAYEQLTGGSRRGLRRPSGSSPAGAPQEPWRADASRARATPGATPPPDDGGPRTTAAGGRRRPGATADQRTSGPGPSGPRRPPAGGAAGASGTKRRRTTKKATFGSTSYDEARDPSDTSWSGASWYGAASGEYWRVNPREYADPRKHGPEYQARVRAREEAARRAAERRAGAEPAASGAADEPFAEPAEDAEDAEDAERQAPRPGTAAREPRWTSAQRSWTDPDVTSATAADRPILPDLHLSPASRRIFRALVAWPPLGIGAAALIGEATGCAGFEATCAPPADLYPWVAQLAILAALLALPAVARVLAGGTIAVLVLAFPVTATLAAGGANYDRTYGPAALISVLAVGWAAGVALVLLRRGLTRSIP